MRRAAFIAAMAALAWAGIAGGAPTPTDRPTPQVAIFYYAWYGTPTSDGAWEHWAQGGNAPPQAIGSNFYPARGLYSSGRPAVVRAQMREIAGTGVDTVIVSWWGPGSVEDGRLPFVVAAAQSAGLHVALHVEPWVGRTPQGVADALRGFAALGIRDAYVYDSAASPDEDWRSALQGLNGSESSRTRHLPVRRSRAASRASTRTTSSSTTEARSGGCARTHGRSGFSVRRRSARDSTLAAPPAIRGCATATTAAGTTTCGRRQSGRHPISSRSRATTSGTRERRSSPLVPRTGSTRATTAPGASTADAHSGRTSTDDLLGGQAAWRSGNAAADRLEDLQELEESVERGREAPAIPGDNRVVVTELLEERDGNLAQPLAFGRLRAGDGVDDERQRRPRRRPRRAR